uniref:Uncharacterized protein n=1 Tax=Ovis aries TaxID=9940 RepID=A0AC11EQ47_SHEEP
MPPAWPLGHSGIRVDDQQQKSGGRDSSWLSTARSSAALSRGTRGAAAGQERRIRKGRKRCEPGRGWPGEAGRRDTRGRWAALHLWPPPAAPDSQPRRHPAGARRSMAASKLVQEIHSIGDRLLLKLQRLPQAEPVEVLAFSVLVVFTATVVLLLLIACGFCCCQYCWPRRRGRRTQVGPMTLP